MQETLDLSFDRLLMMMMMMMKLYNYKNSVLSTFQYLMVRVNDSFVKEIREGRRMTSIVL